MIDQNLLRERCDEVLAKEEVSGIIGFRRKGSEPKDMIAFFKDSDDLRDLVFTPLSTGNPTTLLYQELKKGNVKLGVVVKGCDTRSIIQLAQENEINLDMVHLIGVSCPGVVDGKKLEKSLKKEGLTNKEISDIGSVTLSSDEKEILLEEGNGEELSLPFQELISENCSYCRYPTPTRYDFLIGEERVGKKPDLSDVEELEKISKEKRWEYWKGELNDCIRCHACRRVCPLCYCDECIVDPEELAISPDTTADEKARRPRWLGKIVNTPENAFYHLVRIMHHAGRCIECGECERACPMDIPLMKLERSLIREVEDLFDYEAGIDPKETPLEAAAELMELEDIELG